MAGVPSPAMTASHWPPPRYEYEPEERAVWMPRTEAVGIIDAVLDAAGYPRDDAHPGIEHRVERLAEHTRCDLREVRQRLAGITLSSR